MSSPRNLWVKNKRFRQGAANIGRQKNRHEIEFEVMIGPIMIDGKLLKQAYDEE